MPLNKLVILCGPSGSGKTTITNRLISMFPELVFSISATTRPQRHTENHAKDYHFLSLSDFKEKISHDDFVEYEEVYPGIYYGTLKSELERIWQEKKIPILDIDVVGAANIKKSYAPDSLTIFVHPLSLENLKHRLHQRATESAESFSKRIHKSAEELNAAESFDRIVYNDNLEQAVNTASAFVNQYLHDKN